MSALSSDRFRAIAARVSALVADTPRVPNHLRREIPERALRVQALRQTGRWEQTSGTGPDVVESHALRSLVARGDVSAADAESFMAAKYPEQRWGSGRFGAQSQRVAEGEAIDAAARDMRGGLRAVQRARATGQASSPARNRGVDALAAGDLPVTTPTAPPVYSTGAMQEALDTMAEDVARNMRTLRTKAPVYPAHSVDGITVKPGSLPVDALDQENLGRTIALPGPDEAHEVFSDRSASMDRFVRASNGSSGPGRIFDVRQVQHRGRISTAAQRFRVVREDMRFGVMSCRLLPTADLSASATPGIMFSYGIVISRIPHTLGRAPSMLLGAEAVGTPPVSFFFALTTNGSPTSFSSGGTQRDFYWGRMHQDYQLAGNYPFAEPFGADTVLAPVSNDLRECLGFSFQLITGRDANEVMQQLCSRVCLGKNIRRDGHGPTRSIPPGWYVEAPTVPNLITWDLLTYTHRVEAFNLSTASRIVQGIPFSYEDCAAMVPTAGHFSVVVQPIMERRVSQQPAPAAWGNPQEWHKNGLVTVASSSGRLRNWALDIIVG